MDKQLSIHRGGHLEALLNACPDAVVAIDAGGIIKFANSVACKITERGMNEIVGESIIIIYENQEAARDVNRRIYENAGTLHNYESNLRTKSGKLIPIRVSASHLKDHAGNYIGGVGYFSPYRPWAGAEAEVKARADLLEAKLERASTAAAPVFELYPGLSIIEVVGQLDAERFEGITANLLAHIENVKTRVVLLDLSSAVVTGGDLAGQIIKAVRTVRLLGISFVIAGMQASLARSLEAQMPDLGALKSFRSRELAVQEAFNNIGYEIHARS